MKQKKIKIAAFVAALAIAFTMTTANSASAYTLTGCAWSTGSLRIDERDVQPHAAYLNALHAAVNEYNQKTLNIALSNVYVAGPKLVTSLVNSSTAGWEGITYGHCPLNAGITDATSYLNGYELPSSTPATQLKVVWEHELGHALGLDHVTQNTHVMYGYATGAYLHGVSGLTQDDINGINAIY